MHGRRGRDRVHDQQVHLEDKDHLAEAAVHPEVQEAEAAAHHKALRLAQPALTGILAQWATCHRGSYSTTE